MTDSTLAVIILAAGQGTRMKSQTPKLLHHLAGIPIVSHVLSTVRELDAAHTVTVVRHERDQLIEVITEHLPGGIVVDQDEIPGTGRAVEQALLALPADFRGEVLVVNGDVPLLDSHTLGHLIDTHRRSQVSLTLLSAVLDDPTGYGRIVRGENGELERIVEHKDATDRERALSEVNAGVYLFDSVELRTHISQLSQENTQGEKYLTDVIHLSRLAGSQVKALPVSEPWLVSGINDRAQLSEAAATLNALIIRRWQLAGVTVHDPASTWIDITATLAEDVELLPGTQIRGATTVARGVVIGPDSTIVDCEIGEKAVLKRTDATLSVIGAGASVGPFAYLRPNTILGADGKIGSFVETKNAQIGDASKVPHLSYVGDARIGVGTNIGAGTIFANYDGVTKNETEIGSYARTGSHNVFVAPVTVGDGAYTAAGAVVRKDVPSGALAFSVAPQRNREGWVAQNRAGSSSAQAAQKGEQ